MPGAPAATANSERRGTEARCNRYFTPVRICSITKSGEEVFLVDADHFPNTLPFMSANATRKLLAPMSTPTTCPYPALMRRAPLRWPAFDLPLEVLSSKPFSSRKETAAEGREEDNPQCRSEISPDSEPRSRSCRITSPASICFISRCRFALPGEETAGRNLGLATTSGSPY